MSYALPPIERAGLDDYADLLVAMAINGFAMSKPTKSPEHMVGMALVSEWLQPLLRRGD